MPTGLQFEHASSKSHTCKCHLLRFVPGESGQLGLLASLSGPQRAMQQSVGHSTAELAKSLETIAANTKNVFSSAMTAETLQQMDK